MPTHLNQNEIQLTNKGFILLIFPVDIVILKLDAGRMQTVVKDCVNLSMLTVLNTLLKL